ncbi:LOW QUALITY PROTEIN: TBC1 domain family member 14 [Melanotaenia boesemani]|uniref:LOW QUALITY PROTEIN: TBC1 domain family member 14 n=1 Tax=Melanotaenia boesemani TaxID=1250792 RepID=UPI001C05C458|nr:LOW QUALITY PROTEIN: TBC1 domain family member 14 [Melanotaenia boesemani]
MANTTHGTQDPRDDHCGVSGGAIVENGCVGKEATSLQDYSNHEPSSTNHNEFVLPSYKPSCSSTPIYYSSPQKTYSDLDTDGHSLTSQDSGIPTLEINPPDPIVHNHQRPVSVDSSQDSPATLPLDDDPSDSNAIRKSSTFPRSGYDSNRLFSPTLRLSTTGLGVGGGVLNRSDDISVCSVSSMSTELSVSNEDILDFTVTSDSSAIVTLETDNSGTSHFSEVTLSSSPRSHLDLQSPARWHPGSGIMQQEDGRQKKLGPLASLFNRSLFARRVKDSRPVEERDPGWKLFGKVPLREAPIKDPKKIQKEYETKSGRAGPGNPTSPRQGVRKNLDFEPLSTTALILEDRPANLPAKPAEEAQKHRQQYEEMVAQAKKREMKEAQRRKKQLEDRCKLEESIGTAAQTWNQEILPNWTTLCTSRRVRDLWWQGIPPSVRGKVWSLAVGNELNITHELYSICLARAKEKWKTTAAPSTDTETEDVSGSSDRESSLELIKLDISRTFPQLCIFQQGGPYHDVLHSILGAYTCYRPDVGYVQGMSFIAAVLTLNLDTADAFIAFANLLNKPCQMAFFRVDHSLMLTYFAAFEVFFEENLPKLFAHFQKNNLTPDIYLIDWIFTLYSKSLPLDLACRVWDVFCRDGEEFLFRTALGLLRLYQDVLTCMDFIHMAQFLTRLPDLIPAEQLFQHIAAVHMNSRNRKWSQVLQTLRSRRNPEQGSLVLKR